MQLQLDNVRQPIIASPLWYFGSKAKLRQHLIPYEHKLLINGEIVSPFIGGGSFELYLAARGIRVYASDNHYYLVNFWNQMLTRSDVVVNRIEQWWERATNGTDLVATIYETTDQVDQAVLYWLINKQSWSGITLAGGANLCKKKGVRVQFSAYNRYRYFHSDNLSVEQLDYKEALITHNDKPAYIDPPYVNRAKSYGDGKADEFPHEELRDILAERKAPWVLSYNNDDYINNLYKDFHIKVIPWRIHATNKGSEVKTELLISNFKPNADRI